MDILIVWAWLSWCSIASYLKYNNNIDIIEKKSHIWWNCYDYLNWWIYIHKYWPHVIHTDNKLVINYLKQFTKLIDFRVYSKAYIDWFYYTIPVNKNTLKELWLKFNGKKDIYHYNEIINTNRWNKIYNKFIKWYNKKQRWFENKEAIERFPYFNNYDDRTHKEKYSVIPNKGYTNMMHKMIEWCNLKLNTSKIDKKYDIIIYTWRIDEYYNYKYWKLEYKKTLFNIREQKSNLKSCVITYPNEYNKIRETDLNILNNKQTIKKQILVEYPQKGNIDCYPVNNQRNKNILNKYKSIKTNTIFLWRLAEYKYYNMDQIIYNAIITWKNIQNNYN